MGTRGEQSALLQLFCSPGTGGTRKDHFWCNLSIQREFLSQDALLVQEKAILVNQRRGDPTPIQLMDHKGLPIKLG